MRKSAKRADSFTQLGNKKIDELQLEGRVTGPINSSLSPPSLQFCLFPTQYDVDDGGVHPHKCVRVLYEGACPSTFISNLEGASQLGKRAIVRGSYEPKPSAYSLGNLKAASIELH